MISRGKRGSRARQYPRLETGALDYQKWQLDRLATALDCTPMDLIGHDPYEQESIFQIYMRIPTSKRARARKALEHFAKSK